MYVSENKVFLFMRACALQEYEYVTRIGVCAYLRKLCQLSIPSIEPKSKMHILSLSLVCLQTLKGNVIRSATTKLPGLDTQGYG